MDRYVSETGNQGNIDASASLYREAHNSSAAGDDAYRFQQGPGTQRVDDSLPPNISMYNQNDRQQFSNAQNYSDRQQVPPSVPTDQTPVPYPYPPGVPTDQTPVPYPAPYPPTDGGYPPPYPAPYPPEHHHGGLGRALGHIANFALDLLGSVHVGIHGRHGGGFSIGEGGYGYGGYGYGGYGYGGYGYGHRGGYGYANDGYVNVNVNRYDGYNNPYGQVNYNPNYAYNPNCGGYGGGYYNPGNGYYPGGYYNGGYGYGNGGGLLNLAINTIGHHGFHGFHGFHHRR